MRDRRRFLRSGVGGLLTLGSVRPLLGWTGATAGEKGLRRAMERRLAEQLGDEPTARVDEAVVWDVGLEWRPPAVPAREIQTVVGYSFGNRLPAGTAAEPRARPEPGPVNELLAAALVDLAERSGAKAVYAQWEIAEVVRRRWPRVPVESIEPVAGKDGQLVYLSTDGVAQAVVQRAGDQGLGTVGVVAHRDHAKRCVQTSRARGMRAFVAQGVELPVVYDAGSGQPWTRKRELYLLHDMAAQMMALRAERIATLYPNG